VLLLLLLVFHILKLLPLLLNIQQAALLLVPLLSSICRVNSRDE